MPAGDIIFSRTCRLNYKRTCRTGLQGRIWGQERRQSTSRGRSGLLLAPVHTLAIVLECEQARLTSNYTIDYIICCCKSCAFRALRAVSAAQTMQKPAHQIQHEISRDQAVDHDWWHEPDNDNDLEATKLAEARPPVYGDRCSKGTA